MKSVGAMQYHAFFTYYKNNLKLTKDIDAFNQGAFATDERMKAFEQARRFFKNYGNWWFKQIYRGRIRAKS